MNKNFYIINSSEEILSKATSDFSDKDNEKVVVMHIDSKIEKKLYNNYKYIKFRSVENYSEIYTAEICDIEDNKIYIKNIKNFSADIRKDLKIKYGYIGNVTFLENGTSKSIKIRVKDISCGGLCFLAKSELNKDISYETILPFTSEPLIINIKIIRSEHDIDKGLFEYGCKFINLEAEEEQMIRKGIFRIQRISKRK